MVARGDLGVEIPPEEVPLVQKELIKRANLVGKPVITATHMLESMVTNPRPTRAEANDVANAIFDGSDVIMLSGETANGTYPVESIAMMARIAMHTENSIDYYKEITTHHSVYNKNITNAITFAACSTAGDLGAACIVPITDSGFAARMVSRSRPSCPILAITTDEQVCRQLNLTWGCTPVLTDEISGNDEVFDIAEEKALSSGLAKIGDTIVALAGVPIGIAATTNTLKVRSVGNVLTKGRGNKKGTVKGIARVFKVLEDEPSYFERGDIVVSTFTTDAIIDFMKKAGAIVVGSWDKKVDISHAETVAKALDKPLIVADGRVVDLISDALPITVDSNEGFIYNGFK
jgi:pyruvate kinase